MSSDDASEYLFHEESEGVYVRKCFGIEELSSNMEDYCDGFVHLTNTAAIQIANQPSVDVLKKQIRDAWIAFRHFTPAIACKTFRYPGGDKRFAFRYVVPHAQDDAEKWANETIFFSSDMKPLYQKHCELKDNRWWRCSDDHYVMELHVSPLESGWQFSLIFSHNSIDGRNSFATMDLFLSFLTATLQGKTSPVSSIEWGTEVVRLPPPGSFIAALAESGSPPSLERPVTELEASTPTSPMIPWLYSTPQNDIMGDVAKLVKFSTETTSKLHAIARRNGRTITQVITALSALAHAEASLKTARSAGEERFKEVSNAFTASTHYLVAWNFINHRHKFPGGYDSYASAKSPPLCTCDGVSLLLPMGPLRKAITLDEETQSKGRTLDQDVFWGALVQEVAGAWKATDQSLEGYYTRELEKHYAFNEFNPHMFDVPALIVSSVGDLGRLGLLSSYHSPAPSTSSITPVRPETTPPLTVEDVICGIRIRTPPVMNLLWEYNGQLACHFLSGGEYTTPEALALVTTLFEEWTAALLV